MKTDGKNGDPGDPSDPGDSLAALWLALKSQAARFAQRMSAAEAGGGEEGAGAPPDAGTAEKDARTLSVLVRAYESLRDLSGQGERTSDTEADGGGPDIEALRRELAERLGRLCAPRDGGPDPGADDGGQS